MTDIPFGEGVTFPPPLTAEEEERARSDRNGVAPDETRQNAEPFALALETFIAEKSETPPALIGDASENLLPATGLMIVVAKGGKGKTTLIVETTLHLASGVDWFGFAIGRPLRVLFIENEGPREPFRAKFEQKLQAWPHELKGAVFVHTFDWGSFTLAAAEHAARLRAFVEENEIDVVIGDPLDSLGVDGVGSPEDTRKFMALMGRVGLFQNVAFLLLHHPRKEGAREELDEAAGSWGGKPDSMLRLEKLEGNRARLSFPKIRWSRRGTRRALILAFDPETESFSVAHEEEDEERDYPAEVEALLVDTEKWLTVKEIAAPTKDGGIGANDVTVKKALEAHPDRFVSRTGDAAKEVGRHPAATVWQNVRWGSNAPNAPTAFQGVRKDGALVSLPQRGHQHPTHPSTEVRRGQNAASDEDAAEADRIAEEYGHLFTDPGDAAA
jgi:AAA domain